MNIKITDKIGLPFETVAQLTNSLIKNRPPKEGSFDYGFETHGAIGLYLGKRLEFPIQVQQTNKRKSDKSPIHIVIERHTPLW